MSGAQIDYLDKALPSWLATSKDGSPLIVSRVRLSRNLQGLPFPGRAAADELSGSGTRILDAARKVAGAGNHLIVYPAQLSAADGNFLVECRLLPRSALTASPATILFVPEYGDWSLLVHHQDHLQLQVLRPGLDLEAAWQVADEIDTRLGRLLPMAYTEEWGFLTALPENSGAGMRISALLHLPGMVLSGQIERVLRGMEQMGLDVAGQLGQDTEAEGDFFQFSARAPREKTEIEWIQHVSHVIEHLQEQEKNIRQVLLERQAHVLCDYIGRAYGILCFARRLKSSEALRHLSALRLVCNWACFPN